ncbi:universal stress protein YxiE isoform X2 [Magallana gigas]|uniref:universal stress protein YxiE isoform X2 n=1 Tax=Magallana gigas TaxID=29159 RepID=UPI003341C79B
MSTVIIAIDESKFAENAFKCPGRIIELQREAQQKAATLKEKFSALAANIGIQAEVRIEKAEKPSHGIVDIANKENARFIVTGSRGMGVIRRTILGSVSDFILHHANCPVFVYKMQ